METPDFKPATDFDADRLVGAADELIKIAGENANGILDEEGWDTLCKTYTPDEVTEAISFLCRLGVMEWIPKPSAGHAIDDDE